jgi:FG-GAP repeat
MNARNAVVFGNACLLALLAGHARGQCALQSLIDSGSPQDNAYCGSSAAIDTNYIILGAPGQNVSGQAAAGEVVGFVPVFGTNWEGAGHMDALDPSPSAEFGFSVALGASHTWAIVGAPGDIGNAGSAYIFHRDPASVVWTQSVKLNPGFAPSENFGYAVAMNHAGTIAAASAPRRTIGAVAQAGSVLVYSLSGNAWTYENALYQTDPNIGHSGDLYGDAISADGSFVAVGVPYGTAPGKTHCGYAQVWTRSAGGSWSASNPIYAFDGQADNLFGNAIAVSGNVLAVSAPFATSGGSGSGAVYMYHFAQGQGWIFDQRLTPASGWIGSEFGLSISLTGGELAVGTGGGPNGQLSFLFHNAGFGWFQDARFTNPDSPISDYFGSVVAIDGDTLVSAAPYRDRGASWLEAGGAYVYGVSATGSDSWQSARQVTSGGYTGCTDNCTLDGSTTCGNGTTQGPDAWVSYIAPATGTITIDTQGSAFDTILSVHNTGLTTLACNDDFAPPERWSRLTLPVTVGQLYYIRVAGYGGASGAYTLNIGSVVSCYANCDGSTTSPVLNVADFTCFFQKFATGDPYANCDGSMTAPVLNVADFTCFLQKYAQGCP